MIEIERIRTEQYLAAQEFQNVSRRHQMEESEMRENLRRLSQAERDRIAQNRRSESRTGRHVDRYA